MRKLTPSPAPADTAADPANRLCAVFGCEEVGSITNATTGPSSACTWFCRHHFGADSHLWPEITRRVRLARAGQRVEPVDNPYQGWTREQCQAEIRRIKSQPKGGPKAWAWKLRERELAGERLSQIQRENWRAALRGEVTIADDEAQAERLAIMTEGV